MVTGPADGSGLPVGPRHVDVGPRGHEGHVLDGADPGVEGVPRAAGLADVAVAHDVGPGRGQAVLAQLPAEEAPHRAQDRGRRRVAGAVAQEGHGDVARLVPGGSRADDRVLVAAGPGLPDRPEAVDHEVVGDVGPAPGVLVVGLDRPEHRGDLAPAVGVRVHRVVDEAAAQRRVEAEGASVGPGAPRLPHANGRGGARRRLRRCRHRRGLARGPDQVDDDAGGVVREGQLEAVGLAHPDRVTGGRGVSRLGAGGGGAVTPAAAPCRSNQAVHPSSVWARTRPSTADADRYEAPMVTNGSMPSCRTAASTSPRWRTGATSSTTKVEASVGTTARGAGPADADRGAAGNASTATSTEAPSRRRE